MQFSPLQFSLKATVAFMALAALTLAAPAAQAQNVYSQPSVFPGSSTFSSWTSSSSSSFITSDNFTLASTETLTYMTWQGFTFDGNGGTVGVEPLSFTVEFRADNGGVPGAVLNTQVASYSVGNIFRQLAGTTDFFGNGQEQNIYNYTAQLRAGVGPFTSPANTPLWVSVIGNTTAPNFWTWTEGTGGDDVSYQEISGGGSTFRPGDRAFSFSVVPEASTTASFGLLLVLGAGGVIVAARRKKAGSVA